MHRAGRPKLINQSGNLENQFSTGFLYVPKSEIIKMQSFKNLFTSLTFSYCVFSQSTLCC
jgi:uncharacterized protein Veg